MKAPKGTLVGINGYPFRLGADVPLIGRQENWDVVQPIVEADLRELRATAKALGEEPVQTQAEDDYEPGGGQTGGGGGSGSIP